MSVYEGGKSSIDSIIKELIWEVNNGHGGDENGDNLKGMGQDHTVRLC